MALTTKSNGDRSVRVYALIDPRFQTPFYVGVTTRRLCNRLASHNNDALHLNMSGDRYAVIRDIAASGHRVEIAEIDVVNGDDDWCEAEQFWIGYLKFVGAKLTNLSMGGPGALGTKQSAVTRQRRMAAASGRDMSMTRTPEAREKAASKRRHRISIDGVVYPGIKRAADILGVPYASIRKKIEDGSAKRIQYSPHGSVAV